MGAAVESEGSQRSHGRDPFLRGDAQSSTSRTEMPQVRASDTVPPMKYLDELRKQTRPVTSTFDTSAPTLQTMLRTVAGSPVTGESTKTQVTAAIEDPRAELRDLVRETFNGRTSPDFDRLPRALRLLVLPLASQRPDANLAHELHRHPWVIPLITQEILDALNRTNENITPEALKEAKMRISAGVKGNMEWPQAYLCSGSYLAKMNADLATEERPLDVVARTEPPQDAINRILPARDSAHRVNGINSEELPEEQNPAINAEAAKSVWLGYKTSANNQLRLLGQLAYAEKHGGDTAPSFRELMRDVQDDPLFHGLLNTTVDALSSPEVENLAAQFRAGISAFMKEYAPLIPTHMSRPELVPADYRAKQATLMRTSQGLLDQAAGKMKEALLSYVDSAHPDKTALHDKMARMQIGELFGDIKVTGIDPLRILRRDN